MAARLAQRIGQIQIATAARYGNLATILMGLASLAGLPVRCPIPNPAPVGIAEVGCLALILLYVRWQKRLSARLIASHVGG